MLRGTAACQVQAVNFMFIFSLLPGAVATLARQSREWETRLGGKRPELVVVRFGGMPATGGAGASRPAGAGWLAEASRYREGGARGEVCENSGPVARIASCGSGSDATGFSSDAEGAAASCAGAWCPRWQYGQ
jgi:hypothetical protein